MHRKFYIIISVIILPLFLVSQEFHPGLILNEQSLNTGISGLRKFPDTIQIKQPRFHYSLSTGMSFLSWRGLGTITTQFISPSVSSRINRKFGISGGVQISNIIINNKGSEGVFQERPGTTTTAMLWLRGDYQINPKLGFSGILYKDFTPGNPYHDNKTLNIPQSEGFIIDLQYRPSRNLEINAGFGYHKGSPIYSGYEGRLWGESPIFYPGIFETGPGF